jgi:hypothetical protein
MNMLSSEYDEQQRRLDRLVDGELSEPQRRELLAALDEQPDGWRQCALAFLEAQSWQDDLQAIAHPAPASPTGPQPASNTGPQPALNVRPQSWWRAASLGMLAALAASVMLCFALGMSTGRWLDRPGRESRVSGRGSEGLPLVAAGARVERPADPAASATDDLLTLVLAEGRDDAVPVQVPIVKDPALVADWLNAPPPLPADLRQTLELLGGRVREHRQLMPVRMGDGREVVVPVNRIDLQPVNLKDYQ